MPETAAGGGSQGSYLQECETIVHSYFDRIDGLEKKWRFRDNHGLFTATVAPIHQIAANLNGLFASADSEKSRHSSMIAYMGIITM